MSPVLQSRELELDSTHMCGMPEFENGEDEEEPGALIGSSEGHKSLVHPRGRVGQ